MAGHGRKRRLRGIEIVYEDDDLVVLEKSPGILTQPAGRGSPGFGTSVEEALSDYVRKGQMRSRKRVYLVHRLDRETSGVMMVAKTEAVQEYFRSRWHELTSKTYLARVEGRLQSESGKFESFLAEDKNMRVHSTSVPGLGKSAVTRWRVVENGPRPLVEVFLETGRKNQIRVHFSEAGHPVCGDAKYGRGDGRERLCLHSWRLSFIHPRTKREMSFETARPSFA